MFSEDAAGKRVSAVGFKLEYNITFKYNDPLFNYLYINHLLVKS